ncbi:MAG: 1,4-dihydroxy-2-naphthoate octaprenyltransferase [Candidatus Coatesbacteria bacterium]|nr:1,4-dihydroxy-2-naphthoate octaprenyltransferase [Candidatus Coatesbacteria bacterium]
MRAPPTGRSKPKARLPEPMVNCKLLSETLRAPFFTATLSTVLVGNLAGFAHTGRLDPLMLVLSLAAMLFVHAGANTANDYFDAATGNDDVNPYHTPFNGGSRVIQDGRVSRRTVGLISLVSFLAATGLGLVIWLLTPGNLILWLGLFGVLTGAAYTAPPLRLGYRGLGEAVIALDFGLLPVVGGFYVQTGAYHPAALYAGITPSLLILAVIWINQFPDYQADAAVGKRTLVVRLGRRRSRWIFAALLTGVYLASLMLTLLDRAPWWTLLVWTTLPLAVGALRIAWRRYDEPLELIPAEGKTVQLQLFGNLALAAGYLLAGLS